MVLAAKVCSNCTNSHQQHPHPNPHQHHQHPQQQQLTDIGDEVVAQVELQHACVQHARSSQRPCISNMVVIHPQLAQLQHLASRTSGPLSQHGHLCVCQTHLLEPQGDLHAACACGW